MPVCVCVLWPCCEETPLQGCTPSEEGAALSRLAVARWEGLRRAPNFISDVPPVEQDAVVAAEAEAALAAVAMQLRRRPCRRAGPRR